MRCPGIHGENRADERRRQSLEIDTPQLSLGSSAPSGRVAFVRIGFRFVRGFRFVCEREILSLCLLQKFSFSPSIVKRDPCAYEEQHHDDTNQHPCRPARGCLRGGCGRSTGSGRRRTDSRGDRSCVRDRCAGDRLRRCSRGNGRFCWCFSGLPRSSRRARPVNRAGSLRGSAHRRIGCGGRCGSSRR